jgi:uncharacterized protein YcbK (DUF882 family)
MDVRLKGVSVEKLRDLALAAKRGGVGYYQRSQFVHIDTGSFRTWTGSLDGRESTTGRSVT